MLVWNEGSPIADVDGVRRDQLSPAPALAIWTVPPGAAELQSALETVNPGTVYLFSVKSGEDSMRAFVERLAGLVKHVLNVKNGETQVSELSAAMGHRETTVRTGLAWLEMRGDISVDDDGDRLRIVQGGTPQSDRKQIAARLESLLQETAAYRAYFRRADAGTLVQA